MFKHTGFTLIELLVVVLIIGVLSAVALPQYQKAVAKARFSEALVLLKSLKQAKDVYMLQDGAFNNPGLDALDVEVPAETAYFYFFEFDPQSGGYGPSAGYKKEQVCVCYYDEADENGPNGKLVLSQNHSLSCSDKPARLDYAKLLNLPEVSGDKCGCC
ncbi:MAG: prepilin-type N-terminal cleavage/methylation domain-containing protein [Elusimicrobiaceae bacterium]|nr:prepilin-type N-terminal cleavage/methylation domain-containing protein [Elusimicrobiaceae bacterium]MBP3512940.1 prepilin-type N-terminal cleavage/methylation domain-containing protein [Elusimicrobiaceae bacterium]